MRANCIDWLLMLLGVWFIVHRPVQGGLQVITKIGSTVYQRFTVFPGSEVLTVRCVRGPEYRDNCGFVWCVPYGAPCVVVVTNRF